MFSFSTSFYCFYRRHRPRAVLFHGENTALWSRLVPPRESCLACDMEIVEVCLRVVKYELIVSLGRSSSFSNNRRAVIFFDESRHFSSARLRTFLHVQLSGFQRSHDFTGFRENRVTFVENFIALNEFLTCAKYLSILGCCP